MIQVRTLPLLSLAGLGLALGSCGHQPTSAAPTAQTSLTPLATGKSPKRGIAYDLASSADLSALAPGTSWWYNWSPSANTAAPSDASSRYQMDFVPMVWNGNFDTADVERRIRANSQAKYLLVMNEPNLTDQANLTPAQAAEVWPRYEQIARETGVKIVGPAITWGTLNGYNDPVIWLDAFYAAYRSKNAGREPQIDALAFHWYDYGLEGQLDRLKKYGKPFWVTEFANWHTGDGSAQIDSVAQQKAQMAEMVAMLEARSDVQRYAWFTGRWNNDSHFTSLLGASGQLTELGRFYLSLPYSGQAAPITPTTPPPSSCAATNLALGKAPSASSIQNGGTPASAAFDGNLQTRWSSEFSDLQWLQVDLGRVQHLCSVKLTWEAAYAKTFQIQVSQDGKSWTAASPDTAGRVGLQSLTVSGSGRYVRLYAKQRATGWGNSVFEFQVYPRQ